MSLFDDLLTVVDNCIIRCSALHTSTLGDFTFWLRLQPSLNAEWKLRT